VILVKTDCFTARNWSDDVSEDIGAELARAWRIPGLEEFLAVGSDVAR
jgi:hypothetical protein